MRRSHPPTLITLARRAIDRDELFRRGDVVIVAVSGGRDSMALLHVLALLRAEIGHRVVAHGVDHGLRAEARGELDRAEAFARSLDVPFERTEATVPPDGNLQARARSARHAALDEAALRHGAACVAFAHHADDRAETVLLRLLRGTSPRGLAVLPARARGAGGVDRVRPFIDARRAAIDDHVARHGIAFADDPSNDDPRFLRTRVRRELLPVLVALSPRIVENLVALASEAFSPADPRIDALARSLPRATRSALRELAAGLPPAAEAPVMADVCQTARKKSGKDRRSVRSKERIQLPGGLVATRDRTQVQVVPEGTAWVRRRR